MRTGSLKCRKVGLLLLLICVQMILAAGVGYCDYIIVDTGQVRCYDNSGEITCPAPGEAFYGQDAEYQGSEPAYQDNGDGTVTDLTTDLMWQQTPSSSKTTFGDAVAGAETFDLAGYGDWRLPSIKELYSLMDFRGIDPSGFNGTDTSDLVPFIDTDYFDFEYGDEALGDRIIDAQYWSATEYVSTTMRGSATTFGVNFADGRIKGYGREHPNGEMTQFVRYVRGNPEYGVNNFVENDNGTVTDLATALMWQQADSASPMIWEDALDYAENLTLADYEDWRLPNAKELQSIVDYTRSPSTTASAAIDPVFSATPIIDEGGGTNYPFYWTGTTHANRTQHPGQAAAYIAFGEALGYMQEPPLSGNYVLQDVHGAGAQRSDPKTGDPGDYPYGRGPQGDVIRIYNYVRCVRGQSTKSCQQSVNSGDMDCDCDVDAFDFARFAGDWGERACGNCRGADFTDDGNVDFSDLDGLCANWLAGI